MLDTLDAQILHSLQLSPRIPFRHIAEVLGTSEQTVSRRFRGLRRQGVMRIVGLVNPQVHGGAQWITRIHAKPDRVPQLADTLIRRTDVAYTSIQSGGIEIVCVIRAPAGGYAGGVLLEQLPRTTSVLGISVDLLLHTFGEQRTSPWTGYGHKLDADQAHQILGHGNPTPLATNSRLITPTEADHVMLEALAEDGRTSYTSLAERTSWPVTRVARRITALETSGTLLYDIDLLPELLGYTINAILWLTTAPKHLRIVGEQLAAHDEIAFAGSISGRANLMGVVVCTDVADLHRYLVERLAEIEHIDTCEVSIRVERLKQSGSVITRGRLVNPSTEARRSS